MVVVPSKMRGLNRRLLLRRLQELQMASRAELAKSLGMSQPTAGKIADEMLRHGILEEVDQASPEANPTAGRLGRPGRLLRLDRTHPRFLGVELGVSETRIAPLPVGIDADEGWTGSFRTPATFDLWMTALGKALRPFGSQNFWAALVSVPGIVDEAAGRVVFSPNLHWTEQADLPGLVGELVEAPALLVQEERALALGQMAAQPGGDDFLLADFGDGVGGAIILGGRLFENPLPISGELGHTPVLGNDRPCGCGATGCVETLVSQSGLLKSYSQHQQVVEPSWGELVGFIAANGMVPWLAHALDAISTVIAGSLNVMGLRRAVITGTIAEMPECVSSYVASRITEGTMWARFGQVSCETAPRRRAAGLVVAGLDRIVIPMLENEGNSRFHSPPTTSGKRTFSAS